jgi:hypothetical protein
VIIELLDVKIYEKLAYGMHWWWSCVTYGLGHIGSLMYGRLAHKFALHVF